MRVIYEMETKRVRGWSLNRPIEARSDGIAVIEVPDSSLDTLTAYTHCTVDVSGQMIVEGELIVNPVAFDTQAEIEAIKARLDALEG